MAWKSSFRQNYRTTFSPTVPTSAARISCVLADVEAPGGEKQELLKIGGKQWQATPKNLPRMQRTRAIPGAWLNSGLCPDGPKDWIPIIIIIIIIIIITEKHLFMTYLALTMIASVATPKEWRWRLNDHLLTGRETIKWKSNTGTYYTFLYWKLRYKQETRGSYQHLHFCQNTDFCLDLLHSKPFLS